MSYIFVVRGYKDRVKFTKFKNRGQPCRHWFELTVEIALSIYHHYLDHTSPQQFRDFRRDLLGIRQMLQNSASRLQIPPGSCAYAPATASTHWPGGPKSRPLRGCNDGLQVSGPCRVLTLRSRTRPYEIGMIGYLKEGVL